jgi:hypothetical protein
MIDEKKGPKAFFGIYRKSGLLAATQAGKTQ